jgi:TonB family protein
MSNKPCSIVAATMSVFAVSVFAQSGGEVPSVVSAAFIDMSSCKRPDYPEAALAANQAGTTVLRYIVETDRSLRDLRVERSSGWPQLDQAAIDALGQCKGVPALVNGVAVSSYGRFSYNWRPSTKAALQFEAGCTPAYPAEAIRLELQGTTALRFSITEQGALVKVEVAKSSGSDLLDAAAVSGLSTCKFKPAQNANGVAVPASFDVEYVWKLQ